MFYSQYYVCVPEKERTEKMEDNQLSVSRRGHTSHVIRREEEIKKKKRILDPPAKPEDDG
jgi:hypothetical protein